MNDPVDNAFEEQAELPMPRTPATRSGGERAAGKGQHPATEQEHDLATAPPAEHVEPGTKPERNTL